MSYRRYRSHRHYPRRSVARKTANTAFRATRRTYRAARSGYQAARIGYRLAKMPFQAAGEIYKAYRKGGN